MIPEVDLIVVRGTGTDLDGCWYDLDLFENQERPRGSIQLVPTGRFELRGDGRFAEIWEPKPEEGT